MAMRQWRSAALPAVARRAEGGAAAPAETAWLALSPPPDPASASKPRIGFHVARSHVLRIGPPLKLDAALQAAPAAWQATLQALAAQAIGMGLRFHVFGSLAWQALTGLQYMTDQSDIDLLWYPRSRRELDAGLQLLARFAPDLPLDGEIVFPDGNGVAWKEWLQAGAETAFPAASRATPRSPRVLAKAPQSVRLLTRADLVARLGEAACLR
jgi:phosphoribosyl-dephospho-CoA transferase